MSPAGRPEVGQPINVRLGDDLLAQVDSYAKREAVNRAAAVRALVRAALSELDDDTIASYSYLTQ
ncbi:ribbon-helix-helix protein, CopG family [Mycobacterium intracellulare]|uniref:Ribbon-helix-helix protein, CopG family n=1 Tax=Mycobacterium intracellulare TaxID=1767 RepID=A0AAE4RE97_MYCIT|nr:ribbon-helix-helix protein, CopG family [Mycobacterium intracellulare]MDV6979638.1 ribbon-helix-helix protein, CopG family [Mycobacterium intracellulare]MDV6985141.1 ribbon-helix-helix protein, CopG family [Mycobacterium intracellulare]MDV7014239.1 ribbon-helix-helix protein, CopG family [Mycobacterium intracellulare]MDV7030132.1 ribbon-helix-helix protein, CopG family [Mycobacterium intracellulare]